MTESTVAFDLDMSLDDIDDLPSFKAFPTGAYHVVFEKGFEEKTINEGKPNQSKIIALEMTLKTVGELQAGSLNTGESVPVVGDIATLSFQITSEVGLGFLKEATKPFAEKFGVKKLREIFAASKGVEALVVLVRGKANDKGQQFNNLKALQIP